jgi:choline monooxygenase
MNGSVKSPNSNSKWPVTARQQTGSEAVVPDFRRRSFPFSPHGFRSIKDAKHALCAGTTLFGSAFMERSVRDLLNLYNPQDPLDHAWTIPSPWYFDKQIEELEQQSVFAKTWQVVGRADQAQNKGDFFTGDLAGEPIVVARGEDGVLRAFYNVCRHHAAAVVTQAEGSAKQFRCPYHGWTYGIDGALKGMVEFEGVCNFDRAKSGLVPVKVDAWESFVFVNLDGQAASLRDFLGAVPGIVAPLQLSKKMKFFDRRVYTLNCNWKVYVDNYLDGGYHVPHAHKGLSSVVEYTRYTIENFERSCLQSSPLDTSGALESSIGATRQGNAFYLWVYPNFMINAYSGVMDTNLVLPLGVDKCAVIFDYYFADISSSAAQHHRQSIGVSEEVQDEDMAICDSVQRGLGSRAYVAGRLSVRREAGEHLFHRLLYKDMTSVLGHSLAAV